MWVGRLGGRPAYPNRFLAMNGQFDASGNGNSVPLRYDGVKTVYEARHVSRSAGVKQLNKLDAAGWWMAAWALMSSQIRFLL